MIDLDVLFLIFGVIVLIIFAIRISMLQEACINGLFSFCITITLMTICILGLEFSLFQYSKKASSAKINTQVLIYHNEEWSVIDSEKLEEGQHYYKLPRTLGGVPQKLDKDNE